jgi:hypothetical protein
VDWLDGKYRPWSLGNVSLSGRTAALFAANESLVQLWSLESGEKLGEYRPHANEPARDSRANPIHHTIVALFLVDDTHVLTLSQKNLLTLWDAARARQVYRMTVGRNSGHTSLYPKIQLTPGRRFVLISNGSEIDVVEALTGKSCGMLPLPNVYPNFPPNQTVACSADGRYVAWVPTSPLGNSDIIIHDLASGKVHRQFTLLHNGQQIRWCGPHHLAVRLSTEENVASVPFAIIDIDRRVAIWEHTLTGRGRSRGRGPGEGLSRIEFQDGVAGGCYWFKEAGPADRSWLVPVELPLDQAEAAASARAEPRLIFGPGAAVSLEESLSATLGFSADQRAALVDELTRRLTSAGLRVVPNTDLRLRLEGETRDGKSSSYTLSEAGGGVGHLAPNARPPEGPTFSFSTQGASFRLSLWKGSAQIWLKRGRYTGRTPYRVTVPQGQDAVTHFEQQARRERNAAVLDLVQAVRLPLDIFEPPMTGGHVGYGHSTVDLAELIPAGADRPPQ